MTANAKGLRKSKPATYLSIGTTAFGVFGVVKQARMARQDNDMLRLVDAAVSAVAIATGIALLYRELKKLGDDDVLLG